MFKLFLNYLFCLFCLMVTNATFNNMPVLLVEEIGGPGESSHCQTLSHNVVHFAQMKNRTHNISGDRHW